MAELTVDASHRRLFLFLFIHIEGLEDPFLHALLMHYFHTPLALAGGYKGLVVFQTNPATLKGLFDWRTDVDLCLVDLPSGGGHRQS